ncbi:MAG: transcription elongation factor GreA [Solirubrobacterales bacterium]
MARETLMTPEGLEALKQELTHLQDVKRLEVAERIKEAREFGDISENSEYDDAKNEQAMLEQRIAQLEERIRRAKIIDESELDTTKVSVGVTVNVKDQDSGDSRKLKIVGTSEANPAAGKLSHESPIGRALLGKKTNEIVEVEVPRGPKRKLKITKIDAA